MAKSPPVPPDQQSDAAGGATEDKAAHTEGLTDRRDRKTGVQTGQAGDADVNKGQQGRFGDIKQNTTNVGYQQDR